MTGEKNKSVKAKCERKTINARGITAEKYFLEEKFRKVSGKRSNQC